LSEDSDKDTGKSTDSSKKENTPLKEEMDKNDETEDSSSSASFLTGFKEFLHRTSQVDSEADADDPSKSKTESQAADVKTEVTETESHEDYFPIKEHLMKYNGFRTFISKKTLIMQIIAILAGVFLIIYGLVNSFVPVDKVADNVVFSERAMISVFFIFIGILILAAAFAQKLLSSSFLNKIHSELEAAEGRQKAPEADSDTKETSDNSGKMQRKNNVDVKDNADIKNADIKSNMDKEDKN
jgi:UPF0716 family protein affecting phage T7 exclusion